MTYVAKKMHVKFQLTLVLVCCLALSACVGGMNLNGRSLPPASDPIIEDARDAWDDNNMQLAENLYGKATKISLSSEEQSEVWERLALAASRNGRPNSALDALEQWVIVVPNADNSPAWQDAWLSSVRLLTPSLAVKRAERAWENKNYSLGTRAQAGIILMGRSWSPELILSSLPVITSHYEAQEPLQKQKLENLTAEEVRYMSGISLTTLSSSMAANPDFVYPANIVVLENMRRRLPLSAEVEARAQDTSLYADPSLPSKILTGKVLTAPTPQATSTGEAPTLTSTCLVLALPGSGGIVPITYKIRAGADAAKAELATQGIDVQIQHIDTSQDGWLAQLQALPAECAVVGGPLQAANLKVAKQSQIINSRNFFTFLPVLEGQDEGSAVWRFFPSPQDQINSLLAFTKGLGVISYGSFYPKDNYGIRMNTMFGDAVKALGGNVHAVGYAPNDVAQWTKASEELLRPDDINNVPLSTATFEAVFLPDSWKNMDMITAAFLYNGDDKQVLLGTSLWEQSLMGGTTTANTANYKLAVFPGAWNPGQKPAGLSAISNVDFWTGLGYDFVRFGAGLGIKTVLSAAEVNSKLQVAQNMDWSMAPMSWDSAGKASQKLFLFTLTPAGITLADTTLFNQIRLQAINDFAMRRRAASTVQPEQVGPKSPQPKAN